MLALRVAPPLGTGTMDSDHGPWKWADLGFTVTFCLDLLPEDILAHYGADPAHSELLALQDALDRCLPTLGGTCLRAGTLNGWGFCFEDVGHQGSRPEVLTALSAPTEVLSFYHMSGTTTVKYFRNGLRVESFEPGLRYSLRGRPPHRHWDRTEDLTRQRSQPASRAAFEAIEERVGAPLSRDLLEGPLLTAHLTNPIPSAPRPTPQRTPPGRFLGSLDPTTLTPPDPPGLGKA